MPYVWKRLRWCACYVRAFCTYVCVRVCMCTNASSLLFHHHIFLIHICSYIYRCVFACVCVQLLCLRVCVCVTNSLFFNAECMDQTYVMHMLRVSMLRHACVCVCVRVSETNSYSLCLVFGSYLCDTRVPPPNTRHACVCVWLIHDVWCLVHESDKHDAHVGFFNR